MRLFAVGVVAWTLYDVRLEREREREAGSLSREATVAYAKG